MYLCVRGRACCLCVWLQQMAIKAIMTLSGLERPSQPYYGALHLFLIKWEKMARSLFEEKTASTVLQTVGEWLCKSIGRGNMVKRMQSPLFPGLPGLLNGISSPPPHNCGRQHSQRAICLCLRSRQRGRCSVSHQYLQYVSSEVGLFFARDDSAAWILNTSSRHRGRRTGCDLVKTLCEPKNKQRLTQPYLLNRLHQRLRRTALLPRHMGIYINLQQ